MKFVLYQKGQRDKKFYEWLGPYALDRSVSDEIHDRKYESIYDEPNIGTWVLAIAEDNKVMGFCAIYEKPKEVYLDNSYVDKVYRNKGIGKALFEKRLGIAKELSGGRPIKGITKSECQYKIYLKYGFVLTSKRGRYWWVKLDPK